MTEETASDIAEPIVAPVADAPGPDAPIEGSVAPPAGDPAPDAPDEPLELTADQKAIKKLQGRVGFMTKTVNAKDAEVAELKRQNEAYQALLAANRPEGESDPAPAPKPTGERTYTEKDIDAMADAKASAREFNAQANTAYEAGKAKYDDFDDAIGTLRDVGAMTQPLVEAALATGEAPAVLHYLGNDPDEAARISSLSAVRMGVELAKIATKLSTPKNPKISSAPAPINPLGGTTKPEIDITDPKLSMAEYVARRAQQGAKWAKGRNA